VDSDLELLAAWRAGDNGAGDILISRHFESICRFFRGRLGDDVDDLVQRTFEIGTARRGQLQEMVSFRGYLFGVARKLFLDHLRKRYRRGVHKHISECSLVALGTSPSEAVHRGEREAIVLEAMRRISVDQQIILELAYWEGLSGREIAEALEIQGNTVRSRLSRARAALRTQVELLGGSAAAIPNSGLR
jgi:RNA polymerase sigma-70 factor (ECF subfamily)